MENTDSNMIDISNWLYFCVMYDIICIVFVVTYTLYFGLVPTGGIIIPREL